MIMEPKEVKFDRYPYKALICQCPEPVIDRWSYHLVGNLVPRLLPGTSFVCKCGGYITGKMDIPKEILEQVEEFWTRPEDW